MKRALGNRMVKKAIVLAMVSMLLVGQTTIAIAAEGNDVITGDGATGEGSVGEGNTGEVITEEDIIEELKGNSDTMLDAADVVEKKAEEHAEAAEEMGDLLEEIQPSLEEKADIFEAAQSDVENFEAEVSVEVENGDILVTVQDTDENGDLQEEVVKLSEYISEVVTETEKLAEEAKDCCEQAEEIVIEENIEEAKELVEKANEAAEAAEQVVVEAENVYNSAKEALIYQIKTYNMYASTYHEELLQFEGEEIVFTEEELEEYLKNKEKDVLLQEEENAALKEKLFSATDKLSENWKNRDEEVTAAWESYNAAWEDYQEARDNSEEARENAEETAKLVEVYNVAQEAVEAADKQINEAYDVYNQAQAELAVVMGEIQKYGLDFGDLKIKLEQKQKACDNAKEALEDAKVNRDEAVEQAEKVTEYVNTRLSEIRNQGNNSSESDSGEDDNSSPVGTVPTQPVIIVEEATPLVDTMPVPVEQTVIIEEQVPLIDSVPKTGDGMPDSMPFAIAGFGAIFAALVSNVCRRKSSK